MSPWRWYLWPPCGFFLLSFFSFLAYSQQSEIGCLPYFYTLCGLSANLEFRSKMCCMWSLEIQDAKMTQKSRHLGTIAQLCWAVSLQVRHVSTIRKNLSNSNTASTCPDNMVNLWPTNSWDQFGSLGHPCKFQQVSHLGSVTARHSSSGRQPNFAAGRPSRWALAQILVNNEVTSVRHLSRLL